MTEKKRDTKDISNIKIQGDKMVADIFKSGGDVGSTTAAALTVLANMDRAQKADVIKSFVVLGGIAGTLLMGFKETRKDMAKQYQIPSERTDDLLNTIKELEAVKENRGLEKRVEEYMKELSGTSSSFTAITDTTGHEEPTKKDLQAELNAKVKEIKAIKDRMSEVEKKGKKKSKK